MIADLSDDRRSNKPWLPDDDRDVTNGRVVDDGHGRPACSLHGAMNRVDPHHRVYRCSEFKCGVGAEVVDAPEVAEWEMAYLSKDGAEKHMGDPGNYRLAYVADGVPCEVDGCHISQQEHHRLAFGWITELRELRRKTEHCERTHFWVQR